MSLQQFFDIALIITSIALTVSVILQNKGVSLGGLAPTDSSNVFTARRGVEKTLFWITIGFAVLFFILTMVTVIISQ